MKAPVLLLSITALAAAAVTAAHRFLPGTRPQTVPASEAAVVERAPASSGFDRGAVETAKLRREVADLRNQLQARQMAEPAPESRPKDLAAARAQAAQAMREHNAKLEQAFRDEASDPRWAPVAAAAVKGALLDEEVGLGQALAVDCRSRLCRVEIADDGSGKFTEAMPAFAMKVSDTLPRISVDYVDGPAGRTTILYLSRDNQLPATPR